MQTQVIVTASSKAGNLSRLMLASRKLGLKINASKLQKLANTGFDRIHLDVESANPITQDTLSLLPTFISTIVNIELVNPTPMAPFQVADIVPPVASAVKQPPVASVAIDNSVIKEEMQGLIDAYPNIYDSLVMMEAKYGDAAPDLTAQLLKSTGLGVGQHAAKRLIRNSKSSAMNTTVQNALTSQHSQYGALPVIADLMSTNASKKAKSMKGKSMLENIENELALHFDVKADKNAMLISNCPHCSCEHATANDDCVFIASFLDGFLQHISTKTKLTVRQTASRSAGSNACRFEIVRK